MIVPRLAIPRPVPVASIPPPPSLAAGEFVADLMRILQIALVALTLSAFTAPAWAAFTRAEREAPPLSVFELYAQNRERGRPSYVTADLPLVAYGLLRERSVVEFEERRIRPGFASTLDALERALRADEIGERAVTTRNLELVALLRALAASDPSALAGAALEEYRRVLDARGIEHSTLWERDVDYTQYAPRGRYAGDAGLEGFFRAMRYIGSQRFAVTASRATGTDVTACRSQTRQGAQLARLIATDDSLGRAHADLESALDWQFGPSRELGPLEWAELHDEVAMSSTLADDATVDALRSAVLKRSRAGNRQPRVFDAVVDPVLLEPGLDVPDALTGLRLFGARETSEGAATQRLLYPGTDTFTGGDIRPFGLGSIGGRLVKAFPAASETLALLGPDASRERLDVAGESAFEGYEAAFSDARDLLDDASAAEALHLGVLRAGLHALAGRGVDDRAQSLLAFHVRHRYLDVLYARQPYSPVSKSHAPAGERAGADLEPATELYLALASAAREQARRTGIEAWSDYARHLDTLQAVSFARERGDLPTPGQQRFLNRLDLLLRVEGVVEVPVVVDVHTDPGSATVVQQATGAVRPMHRGAARGARSSFHEFKEPLARRMTPDAWRARLLRTDTDTDTETVGDPESRSSLP